MLASGSLDVLEDIAIYVAQAAPDIVAVWGGDGTITHTLSALNRTCRDLPLIALLPGGTMNTVTRCIGVRGTARAALARLLDSIDRQDELRTVRRTLIQLDDQVGFLFGIGLIPNLLAVYNDAEKGGVGRAFYVLLRALRSLTSASYDQFFAPFDVCIEVDDRVWVQGHLTNISGGGIDCLPFGLHPYHRATEREGAFHLVAHALNARGALGEISRIKRGIGMKDVHQGVFERVVITSAEPQPYNLDGDNFAARTRFVLRGGPIARLVVP